MGESELDPGQMEDMVGRRIDSLVMRHRAVAGKGERCHGLEAVDESLEGLDNWNRTPIKHPSRQDIRLLIGSFA